MIYLWGIQVERSMIQTCEAGIRKWIGYGNEDFRFNYYHWYSKPQNFKRKSTEEKKRVKGDLWTNSIVRGKKKRRDSEYNKRRFRGTLQWNSNMCIIGGINSFSENCPLLIVPTESVGPASILVSYDPTSLTVADWVTSPVWIKLGHSNPLYRDFK